MQDACYLRLQAKVCPEVAKEISDRRAAGYLHAKAAQFFARAVALEESAETTAPDPGSAA
jgi:hypothetical protein